MKIANLFLAVLIMAGLSCCTKDSNQETLMNIETTPSAVVACDASAAGVYKGVIVGSSGYFKLSIKNGDETIYCDFVFDGAKGRLTSTSLTSWTPGTAITNAVFTGTIGGNSVTLTFSCGANGSNPTITVTIPNHTVNVAVFKEISTQLVKVYEGTYIITKTSGNLNGVWNLTVKGNLASGRHKDPGSNEEVTGTVSGNVLTINGNGSNSGNKTLHIDNNGISGSWTENGETVTVTGTCVL